MPLVLHYAPDNASLAVRLVLEEMGVPYVTRLVDRAAQAQRGAGYRALNPNGLIPVLETPDGPIFETAAILLWLADRHGALFPAPQAPGRGAALKWLFFLSNTLNADLRGLFYPGLYIGPDPAGQTALRAGLRTRIASHLAILETAETDWPEPPSILDWYLACQMRWLAIYPRDIYNDWFRLADTPRLAARLATLENRPATRAAQAAEGLGPTPFTAPVPPTPPEGSAT